MRPVIESGRLKPVSTLTWLALKCIEWNRPKAFIETAGSDLRHTNGLRLISNEICPCSWMHRLLFLMGSGLLRRCWDHRDSRPRYCVVYVLIKANHIYLKKITLLSFFSFKFYLGQFSWSWWPEGEHFQQLFFFGWTILLSNHPEHNRKQLHSKVYI